jgi:hypothetical protein
MQLVRYWCTSFLLSSSANDESNTEKSLGGQILACLSSTLILYLSCFHSKQNLTAC